MSFYANIFSALYDWNLGQWHDEEYAALLTAFGLAGGMSFPIGIGGVWIAELASIRMSKPITFAIVVAAFAGHYWLFMRGGRYARLYEAFCERGAAEGRCSSVEPEPATGSNSEAQPERSSSN